MEIKNSILKIREKLSKRDSANLKKKIVHNRCPLICGRWIFENVQNSYWFYFVFQSIFQMSSLNTHQLWALNVLKSRKSGWVLPCFYSLFSNDTTVPPNLWALNLWKCPKFILILLCFPVNFPNVVTEYPSTMGAECFKITKKWLGFTVFF